MPNFHHHQLLLGSTSHYQPRKHPRNASQFQDHLAYEHDGDLATESCHMDAGHGIRWLRPFPRQVFFPLADISNEREIYYDSCPDTSLEKENPHE
jgi:hypothetical protein